MVEIEQECLDESHSHLLISSFFKQSADCYVMLLYIPIEFKLARSTADPACGNNVYDIDDIMRVYFLFSCSVA